jgi:(2R)-sulfolactate sulfo-lyase subunit beta
LDLSVRSWRSSLFDRPTIHIDLDVSGILRRDMTLDKAGDELIEMVRRTANGRNTAAEALGHREFVMTKLYRSA